MSTRTSLTMRPWSGPDYKKNAASAGLRTPCVYCGKPIRNVAGAAWVEVLVNGEFAVDASGAGESQGAFPLGPDCAKRFYKERESRL